MNHPTNVEAGAVPYPVDALEASIAERANGVIFRAFPYLERRYGERGRRFGSSDSGYLLVVSSLPEVAFLDQVRWLATVLACKGLPSWILECHLHILADIGARVGWSGSDAVRRGEALLREMRHARMNEDCFRAAGEQYAQASSRVAGRIARGTGHLIASAVADQRNGLVGSTDPLLDWLGKQGAEPQAIDLVVRLVEEAA